MQHTGVEGFGEAGDLALLLAGNFGGDGAFPGQNNNRKRGEVVMFLHLFQQFPVAAHAAIDIQDEQGRRLRLNLVGGQGGGAAGLDSAHAAILQTKRNEASQ